MHNDPQPDGSAEAPRHAASPIQDSQPVASGEASKPQDQGGFVKLDEHGMVLGFVRLQE